jgi:hypothetical protein
MTRIEVIIPQKKTQLIIETAEKKKCNICGYPGLVKYKNLESGVEETNRVECLGHLGLLEYLWNKHPNFRKYRNEQSSDEQ